MQAELSANLIISKASDDEKIQPHFAESHFAESRFAK